MKRDQSLSGMRLLLMMLALLAICASQTANGQLRICSFNTLEKPFNASQETTLQTILSAIGSRPANGIAKRPDIVALQEQIWFLGSTFTAGGVANSLNTVFGVSSYQVVQVSFGRFRLAYVYDESTVTPITSDQLSLGVLRPTLRTRWRLVGYDDQSDFYTYNCHFKAGIADEADRTVEAMNLRLDADALGANAPVIYLGDFNFSSSGEGGVGVLYSAGNGQAFDPVMLSSWPSVSTRRYLTQSTRTTDLGDDGATGGLDDRFDLQLVTDELLSGEGISYLGFSSADFAGAEDSYIAFGNDGLIFNGAINASYVGREQPAAVLDALHDFSDHLPVVADYQVPSVLSVAVDSVPPEVIVGATVEVDFTVQNAAPVSDPLAADELDYSFEGTGDVIGLGVGVDIAAAGSQDEFVLLDTAAVGSGAIGTLTVLATSDQASGSPSQHDLMFDVLDHSNASFSAAGDQNSLMIDLGTVSRGASDPSADFDVYNLASVFGVSETADLVLLSVDETDASDKFSLSASTFPELAAGNSESLTVTANADQAGSYSATFELNLSDEDLPGSATETITLTVTLGVVGVPGDMNGDGALTNADIDPFLLALFNPSAYALTYPSLDPDVLGDFNGDGSLTNADIDGFIAALFGG